MINLAPGFALFSLLSLAQRNAYNVFTIQLVSVSMGMTCIFLLNVFIYATHVSIDTALNIYLATFTAVTGFVTLAWFRRGVVRYVNWKVKPRKRFIVAAIFFLLFAFLLYHKYSAVVFVEELIILRKIVDNPHIASWNISYTLGGRTTYFFVPFYIFIAMVSRIAGIDSYAAIFGLWPFSAIVSLACIVKISNLLTKRLAAGFAFMAMAFTYALLFTPPRPDFFVVFIPTPDRYALSAALLVPLAIFHFLIHLEHKRINIPTFLGLIYLIVEMTFIHARETIFTLAIIASVLIVLSLNYRKNKHHVIRVLWLILLVAMCLLAYKMINLMVQPYLKSIIADYRQEMLAALQNLWHKRGILGLFSPLPEYILYEYQRFFYCYTENGYAYMPLAVLLLPVYVLCVDRTRMLYLPVAGALFGLYAAFSGLRLLLGISVGVPFVFDCYSLLGLILTIVFCDMLRIVCQGLLRIRSIPRRVAAGLGFFALCSLYLALANGSQAYRDLIRPLHLTSYLLTLALAAYQASRIARRSLPAFVRYFELRKAGYSFAWFNTTLIGLACLCVGYQVWGAADASRARFRVGLPRQSVAAIETIVNDYPLNVRPPQHCLAAVDFIKRLVPTGQSWFGSDTLLPLMAANHYSPVILVDGKFLPALECNFIFLKKWVPSLDPTSILDFNDFVSAIGPDRFKELLAEYDIRWLLIAESYRESFIEIMGWGAEAKGPRLAYHDQYISIFQIGPGEIPGPSQE
ncbi:hypothetical protein [Solidesulfovibrio sp.]